MFSFIHAADIHLDSPLRGLERYEGVALEEIRGASRRSLENLVALAIQRRVDFVIIAGDLYDGDWRDHNTGLFFIKQMGLLRAEGIPVVLIAGNHDAANKMTRSLFLPDNVCMLSWRCAETAEHPRLRELGVAVHGRSYAQAAEMENLVLQYPERQRGMFNIGVLHTALDGIEGHARYAPCSLADLKRLGYDYWALGHVHQRQVVGTSPHVVFSGNTQGRHIREPGAKGCYLVTVDDAGSIDLQFEPVDVMRWEEVHLDASALDSPEEILTKFRSSLAELTRKHGELLLAIRIVISGSTPYHSKLLADRIGWTNELRAVAVQASSPVWVEKVQINTRPPQAIPAESMGDGPLAELMQCYQEWSQDDERLESLREHCQELFRKLPDELLSGDEGLSGGGSAQVRRWLDEALAMLLVRLTDGGRR